MVGVVALGSVAGGVATVLQKEAGQHAAAVTVVRVGSVAEYEAALEPLRKRSDVLERRFARAQGKDYTGPDRLREVLEDIVPEYAALLEEVRAVEVRHRPLARAHDVLLESLERQQEGLETARQGLAEDDSLLVARAGKRLVQAQDLLHTHRRLLAEARRGAS